ncbi:MAG TPA: hypothetical protein VED63_09345, partial [Acidimicrobiales bacterium]|nr:hypothetical protein [Acidimicrobiales bacterium]
SHVLDSGRNEGTLEFPGTPRNTARMIISALEGAMLVARPFDDITRFQNAANHLLSGLRSTPARAARSRRRSDGAATGALR